MLSQAASAAPNRIAAARVSVPKYTRLLFAASYKTIMSTLETAAKPSEVTNTALGTARFHHASKPTNSSGQST